MTDRQCAVVRVTPVSVLPGPFAAATFIGKPFGLPLTGRYALVSSSRASRSRL